MKFRLFILKELIVYPESIEKRWRISYSRLFVTS